MSVERLEGDRAQKTYRYLRIGMIGAAVMLAVSVMVERLAAQCWQDSISGYYYTPVRAVFVGTLLAVGLALIVIKGEGLEDFFLNVAGMLAPVVAFVPTRNVGTCFSVDPDPEPLVTGADGALEFNTAVMQSLQNNMTSLIVAGALGLIVAYVIFSVDQGGPVKAMRSHEVEPGTKRTFWLLVVIVAATALLLWLWDEFPVHAHNIAATGMFVFLALASWWNSRGETKGYRRTYRAIALAMVGALVVILALAATLGDRWDHSILVLEATELTLFAVYWLVQTRDHWRERVRPSAE
jgi:hypothetical protein